MRTLEELELERSKVVAELTKLRYVELTKAINGLGQKAPLPVLVKHKELAEKFGKRFKNYEFIEDSLDELETLVGIN